MYVWGPKVNGPNRPPTLSHYSLRQELSIKPRAHRCGCLPRELALPAEAGITGRATRPTCHSRGSGDLNSVPVCVVTAVTAELSHLLGDASNGEG